MVAGAPPVRLLQVPYDSGVFGARMGAGPVALARAWAAQRFGGHADAVEEVVLRPAGPGWRAELRTACELHHLIADAVSVACQQGPVPLVLSGNCNATLGVLAGLARPGRRLGLVWLDAHGDFNTPETDQSGFWTGRPWPWWWGGAGRRPPRTSPGFARCPSSGSC